jgi:hypothetical protein
MSYELTIYKQFTNPSQMLEEIGKAIFNSEMFGCTSISQGRILALECAAKGCPPMSLAERYHIIHGKLSMKADTILADFRTKCGGTHKVVCRTADRAAIELTIGGHTQTFELTWADARREPFVYIGKEQTIVEKLAKNQLNSLMLKPKYATPRSRSQMMWARVVSDGVRAMAPEVLAGYYTPEEIDDWQETKPGDAIDDSMAANPEEPIDVPFAKKPETAAETPPASKAAVRMSGTSAEDSEYSQPTDAPCGGDIANLIKTLAKQLAMPPAKLKEIVERHNATKLAEIPHDAAVKLTERLRAMMIKKELEQGDIPF